MHFSLQICIFITTLIYCADTAPRRSWGSFAQLLENNKTTEVCSNGLCVHWAECKIFADASSRSKTCSNKHGGPWVCCLNLTGEVLEHSKTKENVIINSLVKINTTINDYSKTKSEIASQERYERNSSLAAITKTTKSTTESTQNEVVIVPLNRNSVHLPMKPFLTDASEANIGIENPNVVWNGVAIPKNSSSILEIKQNETAIVPMFKNGDDLPRNAFTIKAIQNETAVVDGIYNLNSSSSFITDDEDSDVSNMPIAERTYQFPMRREWMEVQGIVNRNYPNSHYYSRRRTWRTSPPRRRVPTRSYWNDDYDQNSHQGSTAHRDSKTTSPSWVWPTKRATKDSWGNAITSAEKTTKSWQSPTPASRNKPYTDSSSRVHYRTTPSLRKLTTKYPNQNSNSHLDKRSTTVKIISTTTRSSIHPARDPDFRDASVNKIMSSGEHRTIHHHRNKPATWNRDTTAPSWSISTGMWSGRRPTNASTTASPRRTTPRSQVTKSTVNHRRPSPTKPTASNPVTGINIPMCGVRQDVNPVASRRGRSLLTEYHPDSVSIYPNSRNSTRDRSFQRIVGGTEAEPFTWPWVAALYKVTSNGGNRFLSAGSLINENFVLTAAHVFTPEDLRSASFVVMLGTHTAKEAVAEYPVQSVLRHPQYQQRFYYNDIALLRLARPVVFNNYVMPVCLPSYLMTDDDLIGTRVTVMGWGDESYGGITSRVLKEATFSIVSRQTCNASYIRVASNRFPRGITTNMLCAGAPDGGKDACQGDSGGPLTTTRNGRHILLGVVSFGYRCGDKDYPGVYTRVASYLNWIAENANSNENHDYEDEYYYSRGR